MDTKRTKRDTVEVLVYEPDFNDLAWSTLQHLGVQAPTPGADRERIDALQLFLRMGVVEGTDFVNPPFLVTADRPTKAFFRQARVAQRSWLVRLKTLYKTAGAMKREMRRVRRVHPLLVQFEFTGLLLVRGKHIHPQHWPRGEGTEQKSVDLTGKVFGRLTVLNRLPGGKWESQCECGNRTAVKTCHLQSNSTKSCGCWARETNERRLRRKAQRGPW